MAEFKKVKSKQIRKRRKSSDSDDDSEEEEDVGAKLQDIREVQKLRDKQKGVSAAALALGKKIPKAQNTTSNDPFKMETGGMIDMKALKKKKLSTEDLETIGTAFAAETNRRDEDTEMLKYVEEELAKRKGLHKADSPDKKSQKHEDALFALPENLKIKSSNKRTEDMLSNQMLSGIPEVDLGIDAKICNIEATENAKQTLLIERMKKKDNEVSNFVPTNMAANFVQHNRFNIDDSKPVLKKVEDVAKPEPVRVGDVDKLKTLDELPKLLDPPSVTDVSCNNISLMWHAWREGYDIGDPPINRYRLYSQQAADGSWTIYATYMHFNSDIQYRETIHNLNASVRYRFRVDTVGAYDGKYLSEYVPGVETEFYQLVCQETTNPTTLVDTKTPSTFLSSYGYQQTNQTTGADSTTGVTTTDTAWETSTPVTTSTKATDSATTVIVSQTTSTVKSTLMTSSVSKSQPMTSTMTTIHSTSLATDSTSKGGNQAVSNLKAEFISGRLVVTWSFDQNLIGSVIRSFLYMGLIAIGNCEDITVVQWLQQSIDISQASASLTEWEFWCTYEIRLSVVHGNAMTAISTNITTPNHKPSLPVSDLRVASSTSYLASITWNRPPCKSCGSSSIEYSYEINEPGTKMLIISGVTEETKLNLAGLQAFTGYSISVTVQNEIGFGPVSIILLVTKEDVPGKPVIQRVTPGIDRINVSYFQPEPANGKILAYHVEYSTSHDFNASVMWQVVTKETSVILSSLIPYMQYYIKVQASTSAGRGEFSNVMSATTLQDYPQSPSVISFTFQNETAIRIEWKAPEITNGVLLGYKVMYTKIHSVTVTEIILNSSTTHVTLNGLTQATYYHVEIAAKTLRGYGPPVTGSSYTMLATPGKQSPPQILSKTSTTVTIAIDGSVSSLTHLSLIEIYVYDITINTSTNGNHSQQGNDTPPGYLALVIYPKVLNLTNFFVIGDGKIHHGIHNVQLVSYQTYDIYMLVTTTFEGMSRSSYSKINGSVTLVVTTTSAAPTASSIQGRNPAVLVVVIVISILCLPALILVIIIVIKQRQKFNICNQLKHENNEDHTSRAYISDDFDFTTKMMSANIFNALDTIQENCKKEPEPANQEVYFERNSLKTDANKKYLESPRRTMSDAGLYSSLIQNMSFLDQYQQETLNGPSEILSGHNLQTGHTIQKKQRSQSFQEKSERVQQTTKPPRPPPPVTLEANYLELRRKACSPILEEKDSYRESPVHYDRGKHYEGKLTTETKPNINIKQEKDIGNTIVCSPKYVHSAVTGNNIQNERNNRQIDQRKKRRRIIASRTMAIMKQDPSSSETDEDRNYQNVPKTEVNKSNSFQGEYAICSDDEGANCQSEKKIIRNPSHKIKAALKQYSFQQRLSHNSFEQQYLMRKRSHSFQFGSGSDRLKDNLKSWTMSEYRDKQGKYNLKEDVKNVSDDAKLSRRTSVGKSEYKERQKRKRRHTLESIQLSPNLHDNPSPNTDDYKATHVYAKTTSSQNENLRKTDIVPNRKRKSVSFVHGKLPTKYAASRRGQDVLQYWSKTFSFLDHRKILSHEEMAEENQVQYSDSLDRPQTVSLELEFKSLPTEALGSCHVAYSQTKDPPKNFFEETYDHSRVIIQPECADDFISASYIRDRDFYGRKAYIAAKSPSDFRTSMKFWKMIIQEDVSVIVKLSQTPEVWPDKISCWMGSTEENYSLNHVRDIVKNLYIIHRMIITHDITQAYRCVIVIHFTDWPDNDRYFIPHHTDDFLAMRNSVRKYQGRSLAPIIVHGSCSDGRTGVFIAIDALLKVFQESREINVFTFVRNMLKDRYGMIKTIWHYRFIYEAIFEQNAHKT